MEDKIHRVNDPKDLEIITPKESRDHPGFYYFPDDHRVLVSRNAKVINSKTGKILKGNNHKDKNIFFFFSKPGEKTKAYRLSRLMARTFVGRPSRHLDKKFTQLEVNHCDGNRLNNSLDNIEWVTGKENSKHAHELSLHPSDKPVLALNVFTNEIKTFHSSQACADAFLIHRTTLWKHLTKGDISRYHKEDFIFKFDDGQPWPAVDVKQLKELGLGNKAQSVVVKDVKNNKVFVLYSLKDAAAFIDIPNATLWRAMKKTSVFAVRDFTVSFLSDLPVTQERGKGVNAFSFRAELPQDIDAFELACQKKGIEVELKRYVDPRIMPEVHVEMWVKATYDEVSAIMNDIDDGHLMYQTIAAGDFKTCGDLRRRRI